jgi:hypothetical protein
MAYMDTPVFLWGEPLCKGTRIKIVHVFGNRDMGGYKGVDEQEIEILEKCEAFRRDVDIGIRGKPNPFAIRFKHEPARVCRGVPDQKWRYRDPEQVKRLVRLHRDLVK